MHACNEWVGNCLNVQSVVWLAHLVQHIISSRIGSFSSNCNETRFCVAEKYVLIADRLLLSWYPTSFVARECTSCERLHLLDASNELRQLRKIDSAETIISSPQRWFIKWSGLLLVILCLKFSRTLLRILMLPAAKTFSFLCAGKRQLLLMITNQNFWTSNWPLPTINCCFAHLLISSRVARNWAHSVLMNVFVRPRVNCVWKPLQKATDK